MATAQTKTVTKRDPILLRNVRLSFPHLWELHKSSETAKPKWSASFLIDPKTAEGQANLKLIEADIKAAEMETWGRTGLLEEIEDPKRKPMSKGEKKKDRKTGEPYKGYVGMMVLTASRAQTQGPPVVCDQLRNALLPTHNKPYAGCYVNARVRIYGVNSAKQGGDGLFASLEAVQFLKDGEPFGAGSMSAEQAFEEVVQDDDEI